MTEKTYLNNADIEKRDDCVLVTTRSGGTPSSLQPRTYVVIPDLALGETVESLYRDLIAEHKDEYGE